MKKTQKLKYRIGFSATPFTQNERQNNGLAKIYGSNNEVNFLYEYSLIKGAEKGYILKPSIRYQLIKKENIGLNDYFKSIEDDEIEQHKTITDQIIFIIKNIVEKKKFKKGIVWFRSIKLVKYFYQKLKIDGIKIGYSYSKNDQDEVYNDEDEKFRNAENNFLMIACKKFTVGYDCHHLEFGINFVQNESGYLVIQKLGRFTRDDKKDKNVDRAYLYQITEWSEEDKESFVNSLCQNMDGLEINGIYDIKKYISVSGYVKKIKMNGVTHYKMKTDFKTIKFNFTELKHRVKFVKCGKSVKNYIVELNRERMSKHKNKNLQQLINGNILIDIKEKVLKKIQKYHLKYENKIFEKNRNWVKWCLGNKLFEEVEKLYYNDKKFTQTLKKLNLEGTDDYKEQYQNNQKLIPYKYLSQWFYNVEFNLIDFLENCKNIDEELV